MLRILVVDDDPLVSQTVQLWLRQQGFDVVTADGAASGLAALEQSQFDLMIIDIFMPHMHGFDSVRLFHRSAPSVPLIAISGYAFAESHSPAPDFLRMALALGATRCLRKPFKPRTLLAVIDECLVETRTRSGMAGLDMAGKMAASRASGIETRKAAVSHHTEN
jgi:CheY-like chemotaxis protein